MALSPGGKIQGISLPAFLQMVQMEKSTCTLTIQGNHSSGQLYIRDGEVIDARYGDFPGLEAAYEIICLPDPVIQMQRECTTSERVIRVPMMHLLMEGARRWDERRNQSPAEKQPLPVAPPAPSHKSSGGKKAVDTDGTDPDLAALSAYVFSDEEVRHAIQPDFTQPEGLENLQPLPISGINGHAEPEALQPLAGKKPPGPEQAAPKPDHSSDRKTKWASLILVFALITVGAAAARFAHERYRHHDAYQSLQQSLTRLELPEQQEVILTRFLEAFPHSPHSEDLVRARTRLREIIQERDYRELALEKKNLGMDSHGFEMALRLYDRFLARHQEGPKRELVIELRENRIQTMAQSMADRTAAEISRESWLEEARRFQSRFPDNPGREILEKHIRHMADGQLKEILALPASDDRERAHAVQAIHAFSRNYPHHPDKESLQAHLSKLLHQQRIADLIAGAGERPTHEEQLRYYEQARRNETNPAILAFIRERITELEQKSREDRMWEELETGLARSGLTDSARMALLDRYLTESPPPHYRYRAQSLRSRILEEQQVREQQSRDEIARQQALARQQQLAEERARATEARERLALAVRQMQQLLMHVQDRFSLQNNGTVRDNHTGKIWMLTDSEAHTGSCLTYDSARTFVQNLTLGGNTDWRLPMENELAQIFKNAPSYPLPHPDRWYWSSELFSRGYRSEVRVVTARNERVFQRQSRSTESCGHVLAVRP
ncbi:DUF4388 domain-containing protein [Desulfobotulus sp. H1]|uniref:DUF4388 domain-containing protein n=1 Tax=Desulfobotulus pelophilus TaxID=2823377 RepID=A0ABT3N810_9BACT|nr:DUF4388 domain-containing protein [Desulfobotulus pelophilus]MCW7753597.1 DUF4388 domain-containing protein [Desulfobotulus pelophilus]